MRLKEAGCGRTHWVLGEIARCRLTLVLGKVDTMAFSVGGAGTEAGFGDGG